MKTPVHTVVEKSYFSTILNDMVKNLLYVLAAVLLLFVISNPGPAELQAHLGRRETGKIKREFNLWVCSRYSVGHTKYFAIAGNFFTWHDVK